MLRRQGGGKRGARRDRTRRRAPPFASVGRPPNPRRPSPRRLTHTRARPHPHFSDALGYDDNGEDRFSEGSRGDSDEDGAGAARSGAGTGAGAARQAAPAVSHRAIPVVATTVVGRETVPVAGTGRTGAGRQGAWTNENVEAASVPVTVTDLPPPHPHPLFQRSRRRVRPHQQKTSILSWENSMRKCLSQWPIEAPLWRAHLSAV